jgi:hypothetical protein
VERIGCCANTCRCGHPSRKEDSEALAGTGGFMPFLIR